MNNKFFTYTTDHGPALEMPQLLNLNDPSQFSFPESPKSKGSELVRH